MTVFTTIVAGFLTFVLGQIFIKLVVDPVHDFKRHVAAIAHSLIEHAATLSNLPVPEERDPQGIKTHFRKLASRLQATFYLVPCYKFTARAFGLPTRENVHKAASTLIGLSNSVFGGDNHRSAWEQQEVYDALGIYVSQFNRIPKPPER